MTQIQRFFARYEEGENSFDPDVVRSEFTAIFMGGDPNGVVCVHNDAAFRKAIPARRAFLHEIGFRSAKILSVGETPLDEPARCWGRCKSRGQGVATGGGGSGGSAAEAPAHNAV